ncbi:hypothetical protein AMTR_s00039p00157860 [Amborella trichopoda]|uniref:UspA domain-containing protein n=2 Tax=Amborella trichopoda TaxID=13333 RepID=U5CRH3_AMBTC|nr:hypothetical protein AMTR_s00039p00157860 [Amborella trichopoda]
MLVADPTRESAGALDWTMSHALLKHDRLLLLHVVPPSPSWLQAFTSTFVRNAPPAAPEFLVAMRAACEAKHTKNLVEAEVVEMRGKDKAATVLAETNERSIDLLVVGQKRNFSQSLLGCRLSNGLPNRGMDTAEYCIENSKCLCVGVQKKGQNAGYLLSTKNHKNFWLLA